jgi:hypothetical protein
VQPLQFGLAVNDGKTVIRIVGSQGEVSAGTDKFDVISFRIAGKLAATNVVNGLAPISETNG